MPSMLSVRRSYVWLDDNWFWGTWKVSLSIGSCWLTPGPWQEIPTGCPIHNRRNKGTWVYAVEGAEMVVWSPTYRLVSGNTVVDPPCFVTSIISYNSYTILETKPCMQSGHPSSRSCIKLLQGKSSCPHNFWTFSITTVVSLLFWT
jgi:hypothetical protein